MQRRWRKGTPGERRGRQERWEKRGAQGGADEDRRAAGEVNQGLGPSAQRSP